MQKFSILWVSLFALLVGGCAEKHYTFNEPRLITLKTPKLKYSDMGYLRREGDSVELELFAAGSAVEKITIDKQVCVSSGCMDEAKFVREYLSPDYPADTMRNILLEREIFSGKGFGEMCNGTRYQYIRNDDIDIVYRRKPNEIYFRDRLNALTIQIKAIKEINASE